MYSNNVFRFVDSIGYGAMALTVTYLPGNRYVNFFLYAILEIPAYIIIWVGMHKYAFLHRPLPDCV